MTCVPLTWLLTSACAGLGILTCSSANLFGTESASRVRTEIQLLCMTCDCHEVKTEMATQLNAECGKPLHPTSACISNAMLLYTP